MTMFTQEHGKIALIVRGVKKIKSKFSGLMEVGNLLDIVYYYKQSRSVQILTEASYIEKTMNLRTDFEKMATMTSAIELISQLLHENEVNTSLFNFVKKMLLWLDETDIRPPLIFPYLQIRLTALIGIDLQLAPGSSAEEMNYLNIESGLISSERVSSRNYRLTQNQFLFLATALRSRSSKLFTIPFETGELKSLIDYLDRYLKFHVEGLRDRTSDAIFEQILQESI